MYIWLYMIIWYVEMCVYIYIWRYVCYFLFVCMLWLRCRKLRVGECWNSTFCLMFWKFTRKQIPTQSWCTGCRVARCISISSPLSAMPIWSALESGWCPDRQPTRLAFLRISVHVMIENLVQDIHRDVSWKCAMSPETTWKRNHSDMVAGAL